MRTSDYRRPQPTTGVWNVCQAEQLIPITDNRDLDSEESLEATIRRNNAPASLPVFTIADMSEFRTDRFYVEHVIRALFDYILRIVDVRGTGRLYLRIGLWGSGDTTRNSGFGGHHTQLRLIN